MPGDGQGTGADEGSGADEGPGRTRDQPVWRFGRRAASQRKGALAWEP